MPTANAYVLEQFNAATNRHDVPAMMALMTADCVFENTYPPPGGTRYTGQAEVKAFWEQFFYASPGARFDLEDLFFTEDRAVQRWVYRWVDDAGQPGHVRGVDIFRFHDGKIAEKLSYVKG